MTTETIYRVSPQLDEVGLEEVNALFRDSWPGNERVDFAPILSRSLAYVVAFVDETPVGFVNVAWDGGAHAFLLDTTVHPDRRGRGVGTELVRRAAAVARERGADWLHVDFEPRLSDFYRRRGFRQTEAGLLRLG